MFIFPSTSGFLGSARVVLLGFCPEIASRSLWLRKPEGSVVEARPPLAATCPGPPPSSRFLEPLPQGGPAAISVKKTSKIMIFVIMKLTAPGFLQRGSEGRPLGRGGAAPLAAPARPRGLSQRAPEPGLPRRLGRGHGSAWRPVGARDSGGPAGGGAGFLCVEGGCVCEEQAWPGSAFPRRLGHREPAARGAARGGSAERLRGGVWAASAGGSAPCPWISRGTPELAGRRLALLPTWRNLASRLLPRVSPDPRPGRRAGCTSALSLIPFSH